MGNDEGAVRRLKLTHVLLIIGAMILGFMIGLVRIGYSVGSTLQKMNDEMQEMKTQINAEQQDLSTLKSILYTPVVGRRNR